MKTKQIKQFFKISALSLALSAGLMTFSHAQTKDEIVAVVDNSAILRSDLNQGVAEISHRLQAQQQQLPPSIILERQALDDLITRQAQLEQVKRYNIKADEQSLNAAVLKVARDSGVKSLEEFQQKLDALAPNTYANFRKRVAEDISVQRLRQQIVMSRIQVTDQDVQNFLNTPQGQVLLGNQVHVLHMRVAGAEQATLAAKVKDALNQNNDVQAIANQYNTKEVSVLGQDMGLRSMSEIPSELVARVSTLEVGQTTELIEANDGIHILKLLERQSSEKKAIVPQYLTRHILISTSEIVNEDTAKQMIESLYNRVQQGEDFTVLAGTFSNDPGSARDGGSLGWVSPGVMVPEFEQRMKDTPVGQVTAPFKSQFGWHILQVTDTRQQDMTREYQERMARQTLGERQFDAELDSWLREVRNNAFVEIKDKNLDPKQSS